MIPIIINKKRITEFLSNYNLGKLLAYKRINSGFANAMLKLKTTQGDYILKIVVRNNPYKVRYEVDLLNFIKNLPVPKPVKAKNGEYLLNYSATNKAFIYKYLRGNQINDFDNQKLKQVGEFLGRLHQQTVHFKSSIKRFKFYTTSSAVLKERVNECYKIKNIETRRNLNYIKENLSKYFLSKNLPSGAIHIDFKPENSIFIKNKLNGVVDFDNSLFGPLIFDLAITMMWFCSRAGKFYFNKAVIIYRTYNKVRKISKLEKNNLFKALHLCLLGHILAAYYHLVISLRPFDNKKGEWYIKNVVGLRGHIKWLINNFLETEKRFTISKSEFRKFFD